MGNVIVEKVSVQILNVESVKFESKVMFFKLGILSVEKVMFFKLKIADLNRAVKVKSESDPHIKLKVQLQS